jgi:hypothetical protein
MGNDPDFLGLGGYNSSASGAVAVGVPAPLLASNQQQQL